MGTREGAVRPPEWAEKNLGALGYSDSPLGPFIILPHADGGPFVVFHAGAVAAGNTHATVDDAKAAAEAYYREKILSALAPEYVPAPRELLEKAADLIEEQVDENYAGSLESLRAKGDPDLAICDRLRELSHQP